MFTSDKLRSYFGDITNWKKFVFLAIVLRGILWFYFGHLVHINLPPEQRIENYFVKDDYIYFFGPVDNFISKGHYEYLPGIPFTGRLPGYSIVYLIFSLFLPKAIALVSTMCMQFVLSSISVYVLALTASKIFESRRMFYITFCLYVLAVFPGFFDFFVIAESFSVSALIFSLYYITRYIKEGEQNKYLVLSGFFLAWTIFLREYTGLLMVTFSVILGFYFLLKKQSLFMVFTKLLLFCIPFIVADAVWVTRNYMATKQIIPITTPEENAYGNLYSAPWEEMDNLVYTWGEDASPFDVSTLGYYFREPYKKISPYFPPGIFKNVKTYTADSIIKLRYYYGIFYSTKDSVIKKSTSTYILNACKVYREDYISHNPVSYWIIKPLKDFKYLAIFSGTGYLPLPSFSQCSLLNKMIKFIFSGLYFFILIFGFAGILKVFIVDRNSNIITTLMLAGFVTIVLTLLFIGTLGAFSSIQEPRYFVQSFMLLVPFAAYSVDQIVIFLKRKKGSVV